MAFRCCFSFSSPPLHPPNHAQHPHPPTTHQTDSSITGDTSYNILLNPKYKEHFGLSWGFAMRHSHVRSIRFDTAQQRALQQELEGDGSGGPRGADMERADVVEQRLRRMTQQSMLAASSDSTDGSGNSPMGYVRR